MPYDAFQSTSEYYYDGNQGGDHDVGQRTPQFKTRLNDLANDELFERIEAVFR